MNERIRRLAPYPMVELARRKRAVAARGITVFDFGTGDPREPTDARIREALASAVPEVSQYPSVQGEAELREAFAAWYSRRFGVALSPETEVLPARGSKEAMFHLPLALVDPSESRSIVVHPEPGYPVMEIGAFYSGAETWRYPLTADNRYLMDPAHVPTDVLDRARIVWINYPHNPTGQDLPEELWHAWVEARTRHGFVLCSDECYTELWFGDKPRSLLEFGREGCLVFHSLSKRSGMTGYRSAIVAGDAELITHYKACRAAFGQAMPIWEQRASAVAWSDESHVEARREVFRKKRAVMKEGLARLGIELFESSSTFYLWCRVPGDLDATAYCEHLLDHGIVASPGGFFGAGNDAWFRLALVPTVDECRAALDRWPARV
ncbi:MAG: succinyldiaminopimelate transaminase [Planctomycetes bacterium]|nr:succinyldiaminopimelate transaminase [Planctomycetota bacterium]